MASHFYIAISNGKMIRLFSCKRKMDKLLKNKTIEEYRKCETKNEADEFCNIYNNGGKNNETV